MSYLNESWFKKFKSFIKLSNNTEIKSEQAIFNLEEKLILLMEL